MRVAAGRAVAFLVWLCWFPWKGLSFRPGARSSTRIRSRNQHALAMMVQTDRPPSASVVDKELDSFVDAREAKQIGYVPRDDDDEMDNDGMEERRALRKKHSG